jgi:hypothetical protein
MKSRGRRLALHLLCAGAMLRVFTIALLASISAPALAIAPKRPIPRINQRHPWGSGPRFRGDSRCGPTTMAMVARAFNYRNHLSNAELVIHLDRLDGKINDGTTLRGMIAAARRMGLSHRFRRGFADDFLRSELSDERLVVLLGRYQGARYQHYILVSKSIAADGTFIVKDPWPKRGSPLGQRRMTADQLRGFVERGDGAMISVGKS